MISLKDTKRILSNPAVICGILAAICYNSWPLAFWLNPQVANSHLASALEMPAQPYSWLFIVGDVLTGIFVILGSLLLLRKAPKGRRTLVVFIVCGAAIAAAALVPESCDVTTQSCGSIWRQPTTLAHGALSVIAGVALFTGLCALLRHAKGRYSRAVWIIIIGWLVAVVGRLTAPLYGSSGLYWQYYFIVLCGVTMIAYVITLQRLEPAPEYVTSDSGRQKYSK